MRRFIAILLIICSLSSLCLVAGADNDIDYRTVFPEIQGHWAEEGINRICQLGLMTGVKYVEGGEDNRFGVNDVMSRAMLATLLYRVEAKYNPNFEPVAEGTVSRFTDVPTGTWYSEAVVWAEKAGVISGISSTKFAPKRGITRQEAATMIYRYAKLAGADMTITKGIASYIDDGEVSKFALQPMKWVVERGIIVGTSEDYLSPWASASRAQFAVMTLRLLRLLGYEEGEVTDLPDDSTPPVADESESRRAIYEWIKAQWKGKQNIITNFVDKPYAEKWSAYYDIDTAYGANFIQVSYLDFSEHALSILMGCGFTRDPSITGFNRTGRDMAATILRRVFPDDSAEVIELMNKVFKLEIGEAGQAIVLKSSLDTDCAGVLRYIDNRALNIAYYAGQYGAYVVIYIGDKYDRETYEKAYRNATSFGREFVLGRPISDAFMEYIMRPEFHYAEIKEKALADLFATP